MFEPKEYLKKYRDYLNTNPTWMLFLFPGFVSYMFARFISDFSQLNTLEQTLAFLGFSITSAAFTHLTCRIKDSIAATIKKRRQGAGTPKTDSSSSTFFLTCLIVWSVAIGVGTGLFFQRNVLPETFFKVGILDTPSKQSEVRPLTKLLFMNKKGLIGDGRGWKKIRKEAWVRVHLNKGEIFEGWPFYYSLAGKPGEIYLSPVCIIKDDENQELEYHQGPGILIYENQIRFIDFIENSECLKKTTEYRKMHEKDKKQ